MCLLLSCEHGGNQVPTAYRALFAGAAAALQSHRGWDPGALQFARQLARTLGAPLYAASTTRLLVDLNRSIGNRSLFSEFTRPLPAAERRAIVALHYRPHRDRAEDEMFHMQQMAAVSTQFKFDALRIADMNHQLFKDSKLGRGMHWYQQTTLHHHL